MQGLAPATAIPGDGMCSDSVSRRCPVGARAWVSGSLGASFCPADSAQSVIDNPVGMRTVP
jgi:hypothetical protein